MWILIIWFQGSQTAIWVVTELSFSTKCTNSMLSILGKISGSVDTSTQRD